MIIHKIVAGSTATTKYSLTVSKCGNRTDYLKLRAQSAFCLFTTQIYTGWHTRYTQGYTLDTHTQGGTEKAEHIHTALNICSVVVLSA